MTQLPEQPDNALPHWCQKIQHMKRHQPEHGHQIAISAIQQGHGNPVTPNLTNAFPGAGRFVFPDQPVTADQAPIT